MESQASLAASAPRAARTAVAVAAGLAAAEGLYMVNVASARNGVGYGRWTHIDGFSESVLRFIHEYERARAD